MKTRSKDKLLFFVMIVLSALSALIVSRVVFSAQMYQVADGTNLNIEEWSVCKNVNNATGTNIMIPTNTEAEWTSFQNNPPPSVIVSLCDAAAPSGEEK